MDEMEREIEECAELMERKGELESRIRKYPLEVRAQARYGKRLSPCPICGMMPEMIDSLMFIQVMC